MCIRLIKKLFSKKTKVEKKDPEVDLATEYRRVLAQLNKLSYELGEVTQEMDHRYFISKDKFIAVDHDVQEITEFMYRTQQCYKYPSGDRSLELKRDEDYEIVSLGYKDLVIFYGKTQPLHCLNCDVNNTVYYYPVGKAKVIKKFRQQRTKGGIEGHSYMNFDFTSGMRYHESHGHGSGNLKGELDTLDEFIFVINFEDRNYEVRVSAHLFYSVEEGAELFMCLDKFSSDISQLPRRGYNFKESVEATKRKQYKDKLEAEQEEALALFRKYDDMLPSDLRWKLLDEMRM